MKVTIEQNSPDPANTLMSVYTHGRLRPLCIIYEEDFVEILTDAQFKKFENGVYAFDVPKKLLFEKSRTWYPHNA